MNKCPSLKLAALILVIISVNSSYLYSKNDNSDLRKEDKLRIREAVNIIKIFGNSIWNNFDKTPFALLLVTDENEYLIYHENPAVDFKLLGYDTIVGGDVHVRIRQFSKNFLATFPAVNGVPTIVVGTPENTKLQSMDWIITLVHEHFHQLQTTQPDYYESVDALELSGDDKSGMWMLNYKFPYDDPAVSDQFEVLTQSAKKAYLSIESPEFNYNLNNYLSERDMFKNLLSENDYKYFSFQIWQEGIARYTELYTADFIKEKYRPAKEMSQIDDYIPMDSFFVLIRDNLLKKADSQKLSENQRECFYTLGALEGLILDRANPAWKDLYFKQKFYVERYYGTGK